MEEDLKKIKRKTREEKIKNWHINKRGFSWSQLISFEDYIDQWFTKYVLEESIKLTRLEKDRMSFGNLVGASFATENPMVPGIVIYPEMEYELRVPYNDITLVGYIDSYDPDKKLLREYKTSSNPNKWNQKSVDEHGQLTMYAFMLKLKENVSPEDLTIHLDYIPVEETFDGMALTKPVTFHTFETKRTMNDIVQFGVRINKALKQMEEYVKNYDLSTL